MSLRHRRLGLAATATAVVAAGVLYAAQEAPAGSEQDSEGGAIAPDERVRVQVLNAGGVDGLARGATGHLRDAGFDVVEYGDAASWDRDSTWVVDRVGRPEIAWAVADALGIGNVRSEPDPDLFVDVTVLLGREWTPAGLVGEREDGTTKLPWWNPRGWLDP